MNRFIAAAVFPIFFVAAASVRADVTTATDRGFVSAHEVTVPGATKTVYVKFVAVANWWDARHTYSGKAANLYLEPRAKGWFGEKLPGGGAVRHLAVVYVAPGKTLRLVGGLGPLQGEAVNGVLTVSFLPGGDAGGTRVKLVYKVGGFTPGGLKKWAKPVDAVLALQLKRFEKHAAAK